MARKWAEFAARTGCRRGVAGPFLFFLILAALVLSPLLFEPQVVQSAGGDLSCHLSGVVEATRALELGQFPLRVAPVSNKGTGYAFFAYYGNFPYTAAGMICQYLGTSPFTAWKIVNLIALTFGGYFTFRSCEVLTRRTLPAVIGGVVFVLAPYIWIDTQVRWAYPEAIAFNVLPAVVFFSLRTFTTRRITPILLAGAAWSLVALSHNIAYLYGSLFIGLLFVLWFVLSLRPGKIFKSIRRLLRVGIGYALGLLLSLWFLVPQFYTLNYIGMGAEPGPPVGGDALTPFNVLFAPVLTEPPIGGTPNMGLQIGWPALAGCLLAIIAMLRPRTPRRMRWICFGLVSLFALSTLMVGMPTTWWVAVPRTFYFVQSSYRLLMFVALFGAMLVGVALPRLNMPRAIVGLLLVAAAGMSYLPRHAPMSASEMTRIIEKPDLGNNGGRTNFLPSPIASLRTSAVHPDINFAEDVYGLVESHRWLSLRPDGRAAEVYIPRAAIKAGGSILIDGASSKEYGQSPGYLTVTLNDLALPAVTIGVAPQNFRVTLTITAEPAGDAPVLMSVRADRYPIDGRYAFQIHRLSFIPATPTDSAFVPADQFQQSPMEGGRMRFRATLDKPALVQLPVLFYPNVMRIRIDGNEEAQPLNVGPYVALRLPAGQHRITVWFAGVGWANAASGVGWIATLGGIVVINGIRWRRLLRLARFRGRRAFSIPIALLCITLTGGVLLSPVAWRILRKQLRAGPAFTAAATHEATELYLAANAFDDNETTEWAVPTGQPEATLTLTLAKPATLRKAIFEARPTVLYEAWTTIRVELYLEGQQISIQKFTLPKAATQPAVEIELAPIAADKIEFHFSSPINVLRDGTTPVDTRLTSPGYREIRLTWDK